MLEFIGSGLLGSIAGGIFRVVPEIMKYMDKKNERAHELAMFDKQCDLEKVKGQIKLDEIGAQRDMAIDTGVLSAMVEAVKSQTEMAVAAGGFAATMSALVRPLLTYYMLLLYGAVKLSFVVMAIKANVPWETAVSSNWDNDDISLLSGVVNYWMLDRTLKSRGL